MSFQGDVEARCSACSEVFETPVWSFVHGGTDVSLRDQIKARELNLLLCAHCNEAFMPEVSWIYYEPDAELMAFVFPESWSAEQAKWREKMTADFEQMKGTLGDKLPIDYVPEIFFGQDGLGALLEKAYVYYCFRYLLMSSSSEAFDCRPINVSTGVPSLKRISVGID